MLKITPVPNNIVGFEHFYLITTWFHTGRITPGPGTWGSLAAWPFCWIIKAILGTTGIGISALLLYATGIWAIRSYAIHIKQPDPPEIVIDEVVGMMVLWMFIPWENTLLAIIGFMLFRAFDIVKRGPVGWCDKQIKNVHGVMLDDVVAGVMAGIIVYGLAYLGL